MIDPADAFGGDDDTPPVADEQPTVRPRTVRARQTRKAAAEARAAAVRHALGGRRGTVEVETPVEVLPPAPPSSPHMRADLVQLGEPPEDALGAQAWLHRAMIAGARSAIRDTTISDAELRKEIRAFAKVAATLLPDSRRWQAEELIRAAMTGAKERQARGPDLEPVPAALELDDGETQSG